MSVGMTDCQARHGAAVCCWTAEPIPSLPSLRGKKNNGEGITLDELRPESRDHRVKNLGLLFWYKAHAEQVLTGCTNIHGQEVNHCLRVEPFRIEVGKRGGDSLEALFGFSKVACSPRTIGLGSWISRCPPRQLSVILTLSSSS